MECVAASVLDARYYWRKDSKEIDFIVQRVPIELKWKEHLSKDDYANLRYFAEKYESAEAFILTKGESSGTKEE